MKKMFRLIFAFALLGSTANATDWCTKGVIWYYGDNPPEIVHNHNVYPCSITGKRIDCERNLKGTIEYRVETDTIILTIDQGRTETLKRCSYEPKRQ